MNFEISSKLDLKPDDVRQILTMRGVNAELRPLIKMTAPAEWAEKPIFEWPAGEVIFTSWILLFGIIPIDRHRFLFSDVDEQHGFTESSSSLVNSLWRHGREIIKQDAMTRITDRVEFACRVPLASYMLAPLYRWLFMHRHKVLRSRYGFKGD